MRGSVSFYLHKSLPMVFVVLVSANHLTYAQTAPVPSRNQAAAQALTQALDAMGGSAAWSQVVDATATGDCTPQQGQDATAPTAEQFTWITQASEFRYESGQPGQLSVLLSGHGRPSNATPNGSQNLTLETSALLKPFHLPGQVFAIILNDPNYIATIAAQTNTSSNSAIHIHVVHRLFHANEAGSEQEWLLDAQTYLPVSVTYKVPGQTIQSYMDETYSFSAWTAEQFGTQVPLQITVSTNVGIPPQVCTTAQLQFNTNPSSSLFDAR